MIRRLIALVMFSLMPIIASAGPITFSFVSDPTGWPWIGREFSPVVVTGVLNGLADNGTGLTPTSILFTSDVTPLGMTNSLVTSDEIDGGFGVSGGVITAANMIMNFIDPVIGGMQIRFNYSDNYSPLGANVLHWNGSGGPLVGMGNIAGAFGGATYGAQSVPEPASLALLCLGLAGLLISRRKKA